MNIKCPEHAEQDIRYIAHYGAPGVGWHGQCPVDGKDWSVVGGLAFDPDQGAHILTEDDVR